MEPMGEIFIHFQFAKAYKIVLIGIHLMRK